MTGPGQGAAVAVVGSANLDLVVTADRRPAPGETLIGDSYTEAPGGKGANQALAAAQVAPTHLIGHPGGDAAGQAVTRHLAERRVGLGWFLPVSAPTGRALVFVTADAENSITVLPGANRELTAAHVTADGGEDNEWNLTGCEIGQKCVPPGGRRAGSRSLRSEP